MDNPSPALVMLTVLTAITSCRNNRKSVNQSAAASRTPLKAFLDAKCWPCRTPLHAQTTQTTAHACLPQGPHHSPFPSPTTKQSSRFNSATSGCSPSAMSPIQRQRKYPKRDIN